MRLIDADALLNSTDKESVHAWEIALAPTIEAEPIRHGHWIYREYKMSTGDKIGYYECSECKHADWFKKDNYCRFCGAKMDEEGVI